MIQKNNNLSQETLRTLVAEKRERMRIRIIYLFLAIASAVILTAVLAMYIDWTFSFKSSLSRFILTIISLGVFIVTFRWLWGKMKFQSSQEKTAEWLEEVNPDLEERLLTSVELEGSPNYSTNLLEAVGEQVNDLKIKSGSRKLMRSSTFKRASFSFIVSVILLVGFVFIMGSAFPKLVNRLVTPWNSNTLTLLSQKQGDIAHPRGKDLLIEVTVSGKIPTQVKVQERFISGMIEERWVDIDKDTGHLSHTFSNRSKDFAYRVVAGDANTDWKMVTMIDKPVIVSAAVTITPPAYTKLEPRVLTKLPRELKIPEGSQVDFKIEVDQEILEATLDKHSGGKVSKKILTTDSEKTYTYQVNVKETVHTDFKMISKIGNLKSQMKMSLVSILDQAPKVILLKDTETFVMKADEQLEVRFQAEDDYGVESARIVAELTNPEGVKEKFYFPIDLADKKGSKQVESSVTLDLSQLPITKDSKLTYLVEVEDSKRFASSEKSKQSLAEELQSDRAAIQQRLAQMKELEEDLQKAREANEKALEAEQESTNKADEKELTNTSQERLKQAKQKADQLTEENTEELKSLKTAIHQADQKLENSKTQQDPRKNLESSQAEIDKALKSLNKMQRELESEVRKNESQQDDIENQELKKQEEKLQQKIAKIGELKKQLDSADASNKKAQANASQEATAKTREQLSKAGKTAKSLSEGAQSQWKEVKNGITQAQKSLGDEKPSNASEEALKEAGSNIQRAQQVLNEIDQDAKKALAKAQNDIAQKANLDKLSLALSNAKEKANALREKMQGQHPSPREKTQQDKN